MRAIVGVYGHDEYMSDIGGLDSEQSVSAADAYAGERDPLSGFVSCCI